VCLHSIHESHDRSTLMRRADIVLGILYRTLVIKGAAANQPLARSSEIDPIDD
jgi:hypothetical protein